MCIFDSETLEEKFRHDILDFMKFLRINIEKNLCRKETAKYFFQMNILELWSIFDDYLSPTERPIAKSLKEIERIANHLKSDE